MRYVILSSIVVSGAAIAAFTLWRPAGDGERVGNDLGMQAPEPTAAERPARPAEPAPAARAAAPTPTRPPERNAREEIVAESGHDDGDNHNHEPVDPQPLETPPPSRDAFGADPASEVAALAEARAILEGLLEDPDPAVRAEVTALLETIEAAN